MKTLNASECIARGCAMMAAMISPLYRVSEFNIVDSNLYPIRINWQFLGDGNSMELET